MFSKKECSEEKRESDKKMVTMSESITLAYERVVRSSTTSHIDNIDDTQSGLMAYLPDEVFMSCLVRVSVQDLVNVQFASRSLRDVVHSKEFYEQRKREGTASSFVCMLQPHPETSGCFPGEKNTLSRLSDPVYGVSVFDEGQQVWNRLPLVPGLLEGLPIFTKLIAVNGKLVAMGGWFQSNWEPSTSVFVYNFASQTWRKGADMPTVRSFFACGALEGKIFVAGGHDVDKKALVSADVYDVESDRWSSLPNMKEERDECTGAILNEKFYVISGYRTDMQGAFSKSAEVFDPVTNLWSSIENMWPLETEDSEVLNPGSFAVLGGRLFALHGKEIVVYSSEKSSWSVVDKIPEGEKGEVSPSCITATSHSIVVTGLAKTNDVPSLRALSFIPGHGHGAGGKGQWKILPSDDQFLNIVQTSCAFEM